MEVRIDDFVSTSASERQQGASVPNNHKHYYISEADRRCFNRVAEEAVEQFPDERDLDDDGDNLTDVICRADSFISRYSEENEDGIMLDIAAAKQWSLNELNPEDDSTDEEGDDLGKNIQEYIGDGFAQFSDEDVEELGERSYGLKDELPAIMKEMAKFSDSDDSKRLAISSSQPDKRQDSNSDGNMCVVEDILAKYRIRYLNSPDFTNSLHIFDGRAYSRLTEKRMQSLIYGYLPMERKDKGNVQTTCKNIADLVNKELEITYRREQLLFEKGDDSSSTSKKLGFSQFFTPKDYEAVKYRIVFRNGVYDVARGKILDFDPTLPYSLVVDADYVEESESPHFKQLAEHATGGDKASMKMFSMLPAMIALPKYRWKKFVVMSYAPDSGKTLLGEFIASFFPVGTCINLAPEHLKDKFIFERAEGAVMYSCFEMSTGALTDTQAAIIKRLTGEGRISIRPMRQSWVEVEVTFKLLLATNGGLYLPAGLDAADVEAFYNRVVVLPFVQSVPKKQRDENLRSALATEKSQVMSNSVRLLHKYFVKHQRLDIPESELSQNIKGSWYKVQNFGERFLQEAIVYTGDDEDRVGKTELKMLYDRYFNIMMNESAVDNARSLDKKSMSNLVLKVFPAVTSKKMRIRSIFNPEGTSPINGFAGIRYRDGFVELLEGKEKRYGLESC